MITYKLKLIKLLKKHMVYLEFILEKYLKKMQEKEQKNLEEVSKYELAFREE